MTETIAQYGYDSRNNLTSTTLANGYQQKQFYATDTGVSRLRKYTMLDESNGGLLSS